MSRAAFLFVCLCMVHMGFASLDCRRFKRRRRKIYFISMADPCCCCFPTPYTLTVEWHFELGAGPARRSVHHWRAAPHLEAV